MSVSSVPSDVGHADPFVRSAAHASAVNRRRRIVVPYDACDPPALLGGELQASLPYRFDYIDEGGTQIDSLFWDIDFSRYMPCLPAGRQWELRSHVTAFMGMVRAMLLEVETKRGRPLLLSVKVPENIEGCRIDGLDVATWLRLNLVDMLVCHAV